MNILTEQDPLAATIKIDGHGTGRMAGCVQAVQLLFSKTENFVITRQLSIDAGGWKGRLVPVGCRPDGITLLDGVGIQFVHNNQAAELIPEQGDEDARPG